MKIALLLLLFVNFCGGCNLQKDHDINFLNEASTLKIPNDVKDIRYQYIKNDDYIKPIWTVSISILKQIKSKNPLLLQVISLNGSANFLN